MYKPYNWDNPGFEKQDIDKLMAYASKYTNPYLIAISKQYSLINKVTTKQLCAVIELMSYEDKGNKLPYENLPKEELEWIINNIKK